MSTTAIENLIQQINNSPSIEETEGIRQQLAGLINELIQNNFEKLVQLLYRIDVSEKKLRKLLNDHPQTDAAVLISQLIIERQQEKARTKMQFKRDNNISPEDQW